MSTYTWSSSCCSLCHTGDHCPHEDINKLWYKFAGDGLLSFIAGCPHTYSHHLTAHYDVILVTIVLMKILISCDTNFQVMDYYHVELDVHVHMVIILLPIMMSCWLRNLKYLVPISVIANICMVSGIGITMYFLVQDVPSVSSRNYSSPITTWPLFFGTVIYAFEGIGLVSEFKIM